MCSLRANLTQRENLASFTDEYLATHIVTDNNINLDYISKCVIGFNTDFYRPRNKTFNVTFAKASPSTISHAFHGSLWTTPEHNRGYEIKMRSWARVSRQVYKRARPQPRATKPSDKCGDKRVKCAVAAKYFRLFEASILHLHILKYKNIFLAYKLYFQHHKLLEICCCCCCYYKSSRK